jgi:hypothetical protein
MAEDDKTEVAADPPTRRTELDRSAANEPAARRPLPAPRKLASTELETLRSRLQRKFH